MKSATGRALQVNVWQNSIFWHSRKSRNNCVVFFGRSSVYIQPEKYSIALQIKLTVLSNPSCTIGSHSITKCFFFSLLHFEQKCQNTSNQFKQTNDANTQNTTKATSGRKCAALPIFYYRLSQYMLKCRSKIRRTVRCLVSWWLHECWIQ
jgi:hypothetical protein